MAVGLSAVAGGVSDISSLSNLPAYTWLLGLVLIIGGVALTLGLFTPFAGLVVGLYFVGVALFWFPAPAWGLHDARLLAFGIIITAAAIALIGPGAYSLDGRLFGRREIVIPPASQPPDL